MKDSSYKHARHRHYNRTKALRTKRLYEMYFGEGSTDDKPLNFFVKGKAHCSCAMCKVKTNPIHKNVGSGTNGVKVNFSSRNWKPSDRRIIDMMDDKLVTYFNEHDLEDYWDWYDEYAQERWYQKTGGWYEHWYEQWLEGKFDVI